MSSLSYDKIYSEFLGNITDPLIAKVDESDANIIMNEYMKKALRKTYIRRLFSSLVFDDTIETLTFTMKNKHDDDEDADFVLGLIGKSMALEWITPQVQSKVNIAQAFTDSDRKFFSQSAHISELRGLKTDIEKDLRNYIMDRGSFYNDYVEGNL